MGRLTAFFNPRTKTNTERDTQRERQRERILSTVELSRTPPATNFVRNYSYLTIIYNYIINLYINKIIYGIIGYSC